MSLQKKIEQEMNDLTIRIMRRMGCTIEDKKLLKMCEAWWDLKRLLEMANSVVEINTKSAKRALEDDAKESHQHL